MRTSNRDDTFGYTPATKEVMGGFQCDKKMNNVQSGRNNFKRQREK